MENDDESLNGPACFLDQARICGPDCMSFLTKPPEGPAYLGETWAKCHLLVNVDRVGRHLVVLADIQNRVFRMREKEAADTARASQPVPPGVR